MEVRYFNKTKKIGSEMVYYEFYFDVGFISIFDGFVLSKLFIAS